MAKVLGRVQDVVAVVVGGPVLMRIEVEAEAAGVSMGHVLKRAYTQRECLYELIAQARDYAVTQGQAPKPRDGTTERNCWNKVVDMLTVRE